jgi:hypothetical protein
LLQTASFRLIHPPTRFERVISDLSQEQRDVIKDMRFGGLLLMPKMSIRKVMLVDVAKKNTKSETKVSEYVIKILLFIQKMSEI